MEIEKDDFKAVHLGDGIFKVMVNRTRYHKNIRRLGWTVKGFYDANHNIFTFRWASNMNPKKHYTPAVKRVSNDFTRWQSINDDRPRSREHDTHAYGRFFKEISMCYFLERLVA